MPSKAFKEGNLKKKKKKVTVSPKTYTLSLGKMSRKERER